jgi:hypothetical protein
MNIPGDQENRPREWRSTDPRQVETRRPLACSDQHQLRTFATPGRMMAGVDLLDDAPRCPSFRESEAAVRGGVMFSAHGAGNRESADLAWPPRIRWPVAVRA